MEIEIVSITAWQWSPIAAHVPLEADSYEVDAELVETRHHWFLKKTLTFELRGPKRSMARFIQAKLGDGSCLRIKVPRALSRLL